MTATARRYDEPVEVRRGMVPGAGGAREEGPEQFLWRGRLYLVRDLVAHWVETGAWWQEADLGDIPPAERPGGNSGGGVGEEQQVWRVEAAAGRWAARGVFDLALDPASGRWSLVRTVD